MLWHVTHIDAVTAWLSPIAHIERTNFEWRTKPGEGLSINMRCLLKSLAEQRASKNALECSAWGTEKAIPTDNERKIARIQVFNEHGLDWETSSDIYLEEVVQFGAETLDLRPMPCGYQVDASLLPSQQRFSKFGFSLPLQVAARSKAERRSSQRVCCHTVGKACAKRGFVSFSDDFAVVSPEAALLQVAARLTKDDLPALVVLCSQFFAAYVAWDEDPYGTLWRQPISSKQRVEQFLEEASGENGVRLLRQANSLAVEQCASPPELYNAISLSMPLMRGGYGQGEVQCNALLDTSKAFHDGRMHKRLCDAYLPKARLVVEYYGQQAHHEARRNSDAERHAELEAAGVTVLPLTVRTVRDADKYEQFVINTVARKTLRRNMKTFAKYKERRQAFRKRVFEAMHAGFWAKKFPKKVDAVEKDVEAG